MKTEDLKAQGLTQEQIDFIMAENGKDVNKVKVERDEYKTQLGTAQETLKSFEGVDVKDLQGKITQLTTDLKTKEIEHQAKLSDIDFNQMLESAITSAGAKNAKAVKALIEIEALKSSKNQATDIKAAIENCQKENSYLFGSNEPINNPVASTNGNLPAGEDAQMAAMMSAMGLPQPTK